MRVFYRSYEVKGEKTIPKNQGVILCVNHVNALIDAAVLQASTNRDIRALARDGLFKNPLLKPILNTIGAVPIYRRETNSSDTSKNRDTFSKCYELLAENHTLVIFPEGQSHSKSFIQDLKTGAARMALGAIKENGIAPFLVPVGMTFSRKKHRRTEVLVHYGEPINLTFPEDMSEYDAVRLITDRVKTGIQSVTLNTQSWGDLDMVKRLEQFFSLRRTKSVDSHQDPEKRRRNLSERFHALQQLIEVQELLEKHEPNKIRSLMSKLRTFERLCQACGISDYHLAVKYQPLLLIMYTLRTLGIVLIGFPIAFWGIINSLIPYLLTDFLAKKVSKKVDQHDTAWVMLGMTFFTLFWVIQYNFIYRYFGTHWSFFYLLSIIFGGALALHLRGEFKRTLVNLKVFFMFMRKQNLREYLITKRRELEVELAYMVRIAKRLSKTENSKLE